MVKEAKLKTEQKWEVELNTKFKYDIRAGKVVALRCVECATWEKRLQVCRYEKL